MRSTYPYDDSASYYDGESDEDSATSTIDSNSRSDSVLEVNFMPTSEESIVSDHSLKDIQQQQGKVSFLISRKGELKKELQS